MKKVTKLLTFASLVASTSLFALSAEARNEYIENAIKERPELSSFYEGLVNTGVINEMNSGVPYTIFAPTNDALAELSSEKYPCLYSEQCREEAADILRNHIVPGEVNFSSPGEKGAFSIDKTLLRLGEPRKGDYTVDGHNVVGQSQLAGGVIYEIDGVLADAKELSAVSQLKVIAAPVVPTAPGVEQRVTKQIYYSPDGRQDGISETVTTTTTTRSEPMQAPAAGTTYMAPAVPVPQPVIVPVPTQQPQY